MTVEHRLTIVGDCPNDGAKDIYELTVTTSGLVQAEDIIEAARAATSMPRYQEDVALLIKSRLGPDVVVRLTGSHSGVTTTVELA